MKFTDVKTLDHLLKEYSYNSSGAPTKSADQEHGTKAKQDKTSTANKLSFSPTTTNAPKPKEPETQEMPAPIKAKDVQPDPFDKKPIFVSYKNKKEPYELLSPVDKGDNPEALVVKDKKGNISAIPKDEDVVLITDGKLSKIAKRKGKKLKIKNLKGKIKKLSKSRIKESNPKLFEINFNKKEIATEALNAPVRCGFEAETFFYSVDGRSASGDVDDMSIGDIEYEFGDLPDQAYEDYRDWLYQKGQDEYLEDLIDEKVDEFKEDEDYLNDFIDSSSGPSSEAIQVYKDEFKDSDPDEFENREEDGWEYINWVREYVEEEYESEYLDWLRDAIQEEFDLDDEATEAAEGDYSMDEWVYDMFSYMSSFLDDYGYDYSRPGDGEEEVAGILHNWIEASSEFKDYPEYGDYGDTYTTTGWAVERDGSIDPDEGTGAEIISPVFDSPRKMLTEMKSLFEWGEDQFGTNNSTGLHVTMSWQGEKTQPNKLKMALLLGDQHLAAEFGRLQNNYTKSQYENLLKVAERMKRGDGESFEKFEKILGTAISSDKFQSIHFKDAKDKQGGNNLIEFRIAGGEDYQNVYEKIVKAVVRYATIMKAGYEKDSFKKDYIDAVFRLMRKSQELDPKKLKDLQIVNHEVIDSAKNIVGKKDYFDVANLLSSSVESMRYYETLSKPGADKEWEQSIKDFRKNTGSDPSWMGENINEEEITGYIEPDRIKPSKGAIIELKKAQEKFARAITIIARDIADNTNRGPVRAKDIGIFRSYAKNIKLDDTKLQQLAISLMDASNFVGRDKENVKRLKIGIDKIFKRDIIKPLTFLTPQELDNISNKMWQFYQTNDKNNNIKLDKLADLLCNVNPKEDKDDVLALLDMLSQERSQNGFHAKLKGGGWNNPLKLLIPGKVTTKDASKKLLKFLEPYSGYEHPTGKEHHVNIKSDDSYEEVAKSSLVQKMRSRLDHLDELETEKDPKYLKIRRELIKIGETFVNTLQGEVDGTDEVADKYGQEVADQYDEEGGWCLSLSQRKWNNAKDFLVRVKDEDDDMYNFVSAFDDNIIRNNMEMLPTYYKSKENFPGIHKTPEVKKVVKKNFAAFKKFLTAFDNIFTSEGFMDLKAEISNKNQYDKRNKDFIKNVRNNAKAKFNVPGYSKVFYDKEFWDTITDESYADREAYLDSHLSSFNKDLNQDGKIFVIPASHYYDAEDADSGLELIDKFEKSKNYFHTWRKAGYNKILQKFNFTYGVTFKKLTDPDGLYYNYDKRIDDDKPLSTFKGLGIEVTRDGDSRKGEPGVKDLVPADDTDNPKSGEPINRSSATSWSSNNDDSDEKQFNAFDWSLYPKKMKGLVAKVMKQDRYGSFKVALETVLQKVLDGKITNLEIPSIARTDTQALAKAAGVEDMLSDASNSIAGATNWTNLADFLKIQRGVNDQGPTLLKKVYDQFDSNHNWRPDPDNAPSDVISGERWAAGVRASVEYIQKNYTVSGGNYFRDGDNVSQVYGGSKPDPFDVDTDDYSDVRNRYYNFNSMMMNGMQNYILQPDVNRLVAFLKNPDNDERFKKAVLQSMMREREAGAEPNDFQGALARGRMLMQNNDNTADESVYNKFDKLSLKEQLTYLEKIDNKKFKNIPNKITVEGAVPDNTKVRIINKLLSDEMPANDIKKQMDAYFAIPNPSMINDFRAMRVQGGDDACLRGILRNYVKVYMHPTLVKKVNLNESTKQDVIDKISSLPDDEQTDKIVSYIEQLLDDMGVGGRLQSILNSLGEVDDEEVRGEIRKVAKLIASIEMTPLERAQLFAMWQKDTLVDTSSLTTPGVYNFKNIFSGYGTEPYMTELVDDLANVSGYGIGAGEFLFAVLSKRVTGIGSSGGSGDLIIDGKNVEVKTKTAKNARFVDWHVKPDQTWQAKTQKFYKDFADLDVVANSPATGINSSSLMKCLTDPKLIQQPLRAQNFLKQIKGLYNSHMPTLSGSQLNELVKLLNSNNEAEYKKLYGAYNILNYLNIKREKGDLDGVMFMDKPTKQVCYVQTLEDILSRKLAVGTIYTVTKDKNYPYPQIGIQ